MRRVECPHESDVLSAVYTNRWPRQVSDELRKHVFDCRICADVIAVAAAFEAETDLARATAHVPDASIVWWRAQLRARRVAELEAVRPITVAQAVGLAAFVGVLGAIFGATATWFQNALGWMRETLAGLSLPPLPSLPSLPEGLRAFLSSSALLVGGLVLFFVIASLAVYVALRATESDA
jgi:hypothetical protein